MRVLVHYTCSFALKFCFSNKFPGDADATGLWTTLPVARCEDRDHILYFVPKRRRILKRVQGREKSCGGDLTLVSDKNYIMAKTSVQFRPWFCR